MKCEISWTGEKYDFWYCNASWVKQKDDQSDKNMLNSFQNFPEASPNSSFKTTQVRRQRRRFELDQNLITDFRRKAMQKTYKIAKKLKQMQKVLIDTLKAAKATFEAVDGVYNNRIMINASLLSNKLHLNELKMDMKIYQFQNFIEEIKTDLGPLSKLEMKSIRMNVDK